MKNRFLAVATSSVLVSTAAASQTVVNVIAHDFRFEAPTSTPAGTITFRLHNAGKEIHHLWIVQLTEGKTPADFAAVAKRWGSALRMPPWAIEVGGPNSVDPGQTAEGTATLDAGTYMLVCWIPSVDGVLHVMKGMVRPLTVTARGATKASEPSADITITLSDYAFDLSRPITAGRHTIRFENRGPQSHEAVIARLEPDHTLMQAVTWMNGGQLGPPPVTPIGGASGLAPGRHMFITADFQPGHYVLLCFIPDAKDRKPHSDHGMMKEIVVAP